MNKLIILVLASVLIVAGYVSKCFQPGVKCSTCEQLVHCVHTPNGFREIPLNFCNNKENRYCSAKDGGCVSDWKACRIFGLNALNCQTAGTFPDPYDCTAYHICRENGGLLTSTRYNCPFERAYDSLTGSCRFKIDHRICKFAPVPKCETPLQHGALTENPNIFYTCVKTSEDNLEPWLNKCEPGLVYENHACVEKTSVDSSSYTCSGPGRFADSENCRGYIECNEDLTYVRKMCRSESYYNEAQKECVQGSC